MENLLGNVVNIMFIVMFVAMAVLVFKRIISDLTAKECEEKAEIIKKEIVKNKKYSKNSGAKENIQYLITFKLENSKMIFSVAEEIYHIYETGQKGVLKYKGTKFIDFT